MMYQAWIVPGNQPRMQRQMLIRKSQEQKPRLMHTGSGGNSIAMNTSIQSQHSISQQQKHIRVGE